MCCSSKASYYHPFDYPIVIYQGQQKWSGCSGFGQTSFFKVKIEFNFYKKQVIKSVSVIFGPVRLKLYYIEKAYQEVLDYRPPTHYAYKVLCGARS